MHFPAKTFYRTSACVDLNQLSGIIGKASKKFCVNLNQKIISDFAYLV
jgi:hypothetical protein